MNREIKFRGIGRDACFKLGTYYFGVVYPTSFSGHYINDDLVDENTIGQYAGLKDKNGKEIYEGDIVELYKGGSNQDRYYKGVIEWNDQQAGWIIRAGKYIIEIISLAMEGDGNEIILSKLEVLGNIYENPELL